MTHLLIQGDAERIPLPDRSVDLVFGSPPYMDCRTYLEDGKDLGIARGCAEWVAWMLKVTREALRVSRGAVVWVASGKTEARNYWPGCEGLMWEWWKGGGHAYRPCFWKRVGIPGSGSDQWFRADVEYAMCFKRPGKLPWSDNTAMGHPPKWAPGREMSYRDSSGKRRNQWGGTEKSGGHRKADGTTDEFVRPSHVVQTKSHTKRLQNGEMTHQTYTPPVIANPGNLIQFSAAGGRHGAGLSCENEAPFPDELAEWFLLSLCPPGGTVLDPFSGSGTTVSVASRNQRVGVGMDLRRSQALLARRRIALDAKPRSKLDGDPPLKPLAGQLTMFTSEAS